MKRMLLPLCLIVLTHLSTAQIERKSKLGISTGYESNVFLNPSSLIVDNEVLEKQELIESGTFQSFFLNNTFVLDTLNYRLKVKMNVGATLFQTELDANRHTYDLLISYRRKIGRRKYVELAPEYIRRQRDGVNEADAVIRTPFSFRQIVIPLHFDYYLGEYMWIKTKTGYLYKNYDRIDGEELYYGAPFIEINISKKWIENRLTKKLTFNTSSQWRKYTDIEEGIEEVEEPGLIEEQRFWNYIRLNGEFAVVENNDKYRLIFALDRLSRVDVDGVNGYTQLSPGISFVYHMKRLTLDTQFKYSVRNYDELSPAENEELLKYNYIRAGVGASYRFKNNLTMNVKGRVVNRESNNTNLSALGFRDYFTAFFETHLTYKF